MTYLERLKKPFNIDFLEVIRAKSEMAKFISEKTNELREVDLNIEKAKNKNPISIGEVLGLMNKKDLVIRAMKQAKDLDKELFG